MKARIPGPAEVLAQTEEVLRSDHRLVLCHIVRTEGSTSGKPGWRLLVRPDGGTFGNLGGGAFEALVIADARARLDPTSAERGRSELKRYYLTERAVQGEPTGMACGGLVEVFLEVMESPPVVAICGGGPVGQALAQVAAAAGFDRVVADDREEFRRPELFPDGTGLARVDREYRGLDSSSPDPAGEPEGQSADWLAPWRTRELYVAVVSRCWETDTAALASVLGAVSRPEPPRLAYVGLMGSRRKIERVRAELALQGVDPEELDRLPFHAPIGLPLGGDTPGEIAVSIAAEMVSVRCSGASRPGETARSRVGVASAMAGVSGGET